MTGLEGRDSKETHDEHKCVHPYSYKLDRKLKFTETGSKGKPKHLRHPVSFFSLLGLNAFCASRPLPIMHYPTTHPPPPPSASPLPVYNRLPYFEPLPLENVYWFYFIFILFIPHEGFNAIKTSFRLRSSRGRNRFFYYIKKRPPSQTQ